MNDQDWLKYWKRFGVAALVNASIFTAYRLYMAYLKKERQKQDEEDKKHHDAQKQNDKNNKPPKNYSRDKELWMDKARVEKSVQSTSAKKTTRKKTQSKE
jgi:hypothetical protein